MKRDNDKVGEKGGGQTVSGLAKKRRARKQKERQKASESTRKEENGREKERVETERVVPLQESEWTLPPGMFF